MNNNENERFSFSFAPADQETAHAEQQAAYNTAEDMRREMNNMKRSLTKLVAICCAICLVIGVGGGAAVGAMLSRGGVQVQQDEALAPFGNVDKSILSKIWKNARNGTIGRFIEDLLLRQIIYCYAIDFIWFCNFYKVQIAVIIGEQKLHHRFVYQ